MKKTEKKRYCVSLDPKEVKKFKSVIKKNSFNETLSGFFNDKLIRFNETNK